MAAMAYAAADVARAAAAHVAADHGDDRDDDDDVTSDSCTPSASSTPRRNPHAAAAAAAAATAAAAAAAAGPGAVDLTAAGAPAAVGGQPAQAFVAVTAEQMAALAAGGQIDPSTLPQYVLPPTLLVRTRGGAAAAAQPRWPVTRARARPNPVGVHRALQGMSSLLYPQMGGTVDEEPLYVNAKQYHRILKRRQARHQLEQENLIAKQRKVGPRTRRRGSRAGGRCADPGPNTPVHFAAATAVLARVQAQARHAPAARRRRPLPDRRGDRQPAAERRPARRRGNRPGRRRVRQQLPYGRRRPRPPPGLPVGANARRSELVRLPAPNTRDQLGQQRHGDAADQARAEQRGRRGRRCCMTHAGGEQQRGGAGHCTVRAEAGAT